MARIQPVDLGVDPADLRLAPVARSRLLGLGVIVLAVSAVRATWWRLVGIPAQRLPRPQQELP